MVLNINYFCQEKLLLLRLKRQQYEFIHAPSVVLFSPMATSKYFSIIECLLRNANIIVLPQRGNQKSAKVKVILSLSVGCLIQYLIV